MLKDLILQTKLEAPQLKKGILPRQRLINLLNENLDKKLILICADAGYGKTTLLAQFCAEFKNPFLFYDLDANDNDLATFFNYLVAGIQRHYPDFGKRVKSAISQTRNIEIVVGTFINEFVKQGTKAPTPGRDFYIILDDYHHLQQNSEIGTALDYLLRHLPQHLHLIISSRSTPPLDLTYYLAKQDLFQIDKAQLQFNLKEIRGLLEEIYGFKIPDNEIAMIEKHSEGWITAIQLILQKVSAVGEDKAGETLNSYISSGEEIFNYFAREVFENQTKEIQQFLMKISILEELDASVCNYLVGIRRSNRILSYLESEHIFVTKISSSKYRYHPLFHEFLYKRLKTSSSSSQVRRLYKIVGAYYTKNGDYLNAAKYLLKAEYYHQAAMVLTKYQSVMPEEMISTFGRLIDQIPLSIIDKDPALLLGKSRYLSYAGKWKDALQNAIKARRILQRGKDYRKLIGVLQRIGLIYRVMMQPLKALRYAKKAFELTSKRNYLTKAEIMVLLGNIYRALLRYDDAENYFSKALSIARRMNTTRIKLEALNGLAHLYAEKTDFRAARAIFSEIFAICENQPSTLFYGYICATAAVLYIEIYDFDKANELLSHAEEIAVLYNDKRTSAYLSAIRGKFYFYQGDYLKAMECYKKALELNKEMEERLIDLHAQIDLIYLNLRMNRGEDGRILLKKVEEMISNQRPQPMLIDFYLVKGEMDKMARNFQSAEENFRQALTIAAKAQKRYDEMKIYYALAQLHFESGDIEQFVRYLSQSFEIAQERDYDFFLIKEAKENWSLFEKAVEKDIDTAYLSRIFRKVDTSEAKDLLERMGKDESEYELEITLFGNIVIKDRNGKVVSPHWKTQKTKALFVYLIINQGKLISKDHLRQIFWPNKGLTEATHSLHDQIYFVRKIFQELLGDDRRSKEIIRYCNPFYSLSQDILLKIDIYEFDRFIKKATSLEPAAVDKSIELYKKALSLYQGDFCPELYEDWADEKRLFYQEKVVKLIKKLAGDHYRKADYKESLELYKSALRYDQLDEDIHIWIMRCLKMLGDKAGVKAQYQELEKALKKNLHTTPSIETQKIYQELLSH